MKLDQEFAKLIAWLRANKLEAHTTKADPLRICRRHPRKSRLTGEPR